MICNTLELQYIQISFRMEKWKLISASWPKATGAAASRVGQLKINKYINSQHPLNVFSLRGTLLKVHTEMNVWHEIYQKMCSNAIELMVKTIRTRRHIARLPGRVYDGCQNICCAGVTACGRGTLAMAHFKWKISKQMKFISCFFREYQRETRKRHCRNSSNTF